MHSGQLSVFGRGDTLTIESSTSQDSRAAALDVVILGGRPIAEPVVWHGPFVMNTEQEIRQAFDDFESGKLGAIPPTAKGR